jgi:nucleoside recognition membrane protein YjiH
MAFPPVDWVAIVLCLILGVVSGSIWFNPKTFFPMWWRGMGKSDQDQPGAGQNMGIVFGLTFGATLVQAIGLATMVGMVYPQGYSVIQAVSVGVLVWAGIIAPTSLVNKLFAGHHLSSWLIETSNHLLNMCLFGVVLGLFI